MSLLEWNHSYSVNVKEIDDQHKNLINYINESLRVTRNGQERRY